MFFLFCSKTDIEATWLYDQVTANHDIDAEILFVEDLYDCRNWHLRVSDDISFAEVILPGGRKINTGNVTLFLNRVNSVHHPFWEKKELIERQYFQQEWNAFLLGWLKAFEAVLVNKLSPTSFSGFSGTSLRWSLMAHKAGFVVKPQSYLSDDKDMTCIFTPNISKRTKSLLVFNKKVYCSMELARFSDECLNLAAHCHCNLLEVYVEKRGNGQYKFITANSLPAFSKYSQSFIRAFRFSLIEAQKLLPGKKYKNELVETF